MVILFTLRFHNCKHATEGACPVAPEPSLYYLTVKRNSFLLPPNFPVHEAEVLGNVSPFKPLKRLN